MNRQEMQAEFDRLGSQFRIIQNSVGLIDDEIISLASQQLCVSICGSLEQLLKGIFVQYGIINSNSKIHRPISRICETYQNPKSKKVIELIGLFDDEFSKQLNDYWEGEGNLERDHLNNLVDDRISIAHRRRLHVNIGIQKLQNYLRCYKAIAEKVLKHFLEN